MPADMEVHMSIFIKLSFILAWKRAWSQLDLECKLFVASRKNYILASQGKYKGICGTNMNGIAESRETLLDWVHCIR